MLTVQDCAKLRITVYIIRIYNTLQNTLAPFNTAVHTSMQPHKWLRSGKATELLWLKKNRKNPAGILPNSGRAKCFARCIRTDTVTNRPAQRFTCELSIV